MNEFDIVKEFFSNLRCTQCSEQFTPESISILRNEANYTVVRVICSNCQKNIGLAILGLNKKEMKNALNTNESDFPFETDSTNSPIDYDDVIDAHEFFSNLGADWTKYIPQIRE